MPVNSRLQELHKLGQSPWLDQIDRRLIQDGSLKNIFEAGILGVTTNPTIFEKSISGSEVYDEQINTLVRGHKSAEEIYDHLTLTDVGLAADLLKPAFIDSESWDGFVSIETWPKFAYDAEKTLDYAFRIFKALNRKNIMIKVPGTKESLSAIRRLISQGINVNVTLLFSVAHYEPIAYAYIEGLEERLKKGLPLAEVNSVASIFVSRLDTRVDKVLEEKNPALCGRAAVANAQLIYAKFKEIFSDKNFGRLKSKGGHIQRLLWASTSTKNPLYKDIKYIEELIAPNTINTMPLPTIEAFKDHGTPKIAITDDCIPAQKVFDDLRAFGIDINQICEVLQEEGLKSFSDSFDNLIDSIQRKIKT